MARFVLVHGSWHGGWCWHRLLPLLEAAGHEATAFDLPGSGDDPAPPSAADLDLYVGRTLEILARPTEAAATILVGHSLGGLTLSAVAEAAPERLAGLVYVTALLLPDGMDAVRWRAGQPPNPPARARVMAADGTSTLPAAAAIDCFYGDCAPEDAAWAAARLGPQAMRLYGSPLWLSEARWGQVPRWYIRCALDVTIPPAEQDRMLAAVPGTGTFTLDAGHSPMLSVPAALADCLGRVAQELA